MFPVIFIVYLKMGVESKRRCVSKMTKRLEYWMSDII